MCCLTKNWLISSAMGLVVVLAATATANACGGGVVRIIRAYRAPSPRVVYAPQQQLRNPQFTNNGMPFQGVPNGPFQGQPNQFQGQPQFQSQPNQLQGPQGQMVNGQFQGQPNQFNGQPNQFQSPDANSQAIDALRGSPMQNGFQGNSNMGNSNLGPQNNMIAGPQNNQFQGQPNQF